MFHGVLLVNKPTGITSFDVIRKVKHRFKGYKIGHAGTLDPDASGLLILILGEATKISQYILAEEKRYTVDLRLGVDSDTFDSSGVIKEVSHRVVAEDELMRALSQFVGEINQQVPAFSAVKVNGAKLYELARKGVKVIAPTKLVTIYSIKLRSFNYPTAQIEVHCSKGTYMRSLAHDIGASLSVGCITTHIYRSQSGTFNVKDATKLDDLITMDDVSLSSRVIHIEGVLSSWLKVKIPASMEVGIRNGNSISRDMLDECEYDRTLETFSEPVLLVTQRHRALAIGQFGLDQSLKITRLFNI